MDLWIGMAINILLQLLANKKEAPKWFPALAKVYNGIGMAAAVDPRLRAEIEHQEKKTGAR